MKFIFVRFLSLIFLQSLFLQKKDLKHYFRQIQFVQFNLFRQDSSVNNVDGNLSTLMEPAVKFIDPLNFNQTFQPKHVLGNTFQLLYANGNIYFILYSTPRLHQKCRII